MNSEERVELAWRRLAARAADETLQDHELFEFAIVEAVAAGIVEFTEVGREWAAKHGQKEVQKWIL